MNLVTVIILCLTAFCVLAGTIFLAGTKIPAPSATVERVLSNDRFPD